MKRFFVLKITLLAIIPSFFILPISSAKDNSIPRVWTTYRVHDGYDKDFQNLKENGVDAVQINVGSDKIPNLLEAAREHDIKLIMHVPEVPEHAYNIPQEEVVRAVMIAGAYQGKAIDRHRFSFTPEKHEIVIENPIYDKTNCYDTLGHYFPGMRDPLKAEVIVKQADFDGEAHVKIIPAKTEPKDEHHWTMSFDLTGVEGDLENCILAVYWISEGTRDYWMFGDAASTFAESTQKKVKESTLDEIEKWKKGNGGEFPKDVVFALRFGDECFHVSGHLNSEGCSYPLWDYSEPALENYQKKYPGRIYPRGKNFIDVFGRNAYASWMYEFHKSCAELVSIVKDTLVSEGLGDIIVFRNITRSSVFHSMNDHDGSGLELLVKALDVAHLDPYPVNASGYKQINIPRDMCYVAGLARRHDKYLVPWMQSHTYWASRGGLTHPSPNDITQMFSQHFPHHPDAIMWLGWGKNYTFPKQKPEAWKEASRQHFRFKAMDWEPLMIQFAVVRPYSVRALRGVDDYHPLDSFFTDTIIHNLVMRQLQFYDAFEPLYASSLKASDFQPYNYVLAEVGNLSEKSVRPFIDAGKPTVIFIHGADRFDISKDVTGIEKYVKTARNTTMTTLKPNEENISIQSADLFELTSDARILAKIDDKACVWRYKDVIFVSTVTKSRDTHMPKWLWSFLNNTKK